MNMMPQPEPPQAFSEVAWLRQQIELAYEGASNGLTGYTEMARHEAITTKMVRVAGYSERLQQLVGTEEGIRITVEAMNMGTNGTESQVVPS